MDAWVGHQVGLELGDINVQSTIETERRREGRDDLSNQTVQVGVGRALNVKVAAADIVEGLVVKAEGTILYRRQGKRVRNTGDQC